MGYLLGLDNGGTVTKAAIFDFYGNQIAVSKVNSEKFLSKPGYVERAMGELLNSNYYCIREVIKNSGLKPEEIKAISFSGHGKGLYLLDHDKKEFTNGILSSDSRAELIIDRWRGDGTSNIVYELTSQHLSPTHAPVLLKWLKENDSDIYNQIGYALSVNDYLRFKLTGELYSELTMASGNNLINIHTETYDNRILDVLGMSEMNKALSPLKKSSEICGNITSESAFRTGLSEGTPVIAGLFDINASGISSGLLDEDTMCIIGGTWSINQFLSKTKNNYESTTKQTLYCKEGFVLVEESSATSASNLQWFIDSIMIPLGYQKDSETMFKEIKEWVETVGESDLSLIFIPQLYGGIEDIEVSAQFYGLKAIHNYKSLVRAIYEGITFSHRYHCEKLQKNHPTGFDSIMLAGGITNSDIWVQMFADSFQKDIYSVNNVELGALGASITAGVGIGVYSSYDDAYEKISICHKKFEFNKNKKQYYDKKYELFKKILKERGK